MPISTERGTAGLFRPGRSPGWLEDGYPMALPQPAAEGLATALLVSAIGVTAALLALRQRYERRHRDPALSDADRRHFARQDLRRALAGLVMVLLALGIAAGTRFEPKRAGRANPWFLADWFAVCILILGLLWLALVDWSATWLYGWRHRRALTRERLQFLREQRRQRRAYRSNGRGTPTEPPDGAPNG